MISFMWHLSRPLDTLSALTLLIKSKLVFKNVSVSERRYRRSSSRLLYTSQTRQKYWHSKSDVTMGDIHRGTPQR